MERIEKMGKLYVSYVDYTISIQIDWVYIDNGVETMRQPKDVRGFVPGQIEQVKAYIGMEESPEITYLESIWTQEVIDAYNAFIQSQEQE